MSLLATTKLFAAPLPSACELSEGVLAYCATSEVSQKLGGSASVCAVGVFDGVHLGHRALINAALQEAQASGALSIAVTFNPDPSSVLSPGHAQEALLTFEERVALLLSLDLDAVVAISFTSDFASLTYQEFLSDYLAQTLRCTSLHVGTNFRMGKGGLGTPDAMRACAEDYHMDVQAHELESVLGHPVSSTRIRSLLCAGKVEPAASLLGRPHVLCGVVEHGRGQGTSFGFPTANIKISGNQCMPAEGVYAAYVGDGNHMWPAAVNVGAPRTFGGTVGVPLVEATLVGFEGDLYDKQLFCCFHSWLRGPKHFPTLQKLESTVLSNIDWVRDNLGEGELSD